jgi:hypothetical protein
LRHFLDHKLHQNLRSWMFQSKGTKPFYQKQFDCAASICFYA